MITFRVVKTMLSVLAPTTGAVHAGSAETPILKEGATRMRRICRETARATAFFLLIVLSAGCALDVAGIPGIETPPNSEPNAYTCSCTCTGDPFDIKADFNVCVPDGLNKNKPGGLEATRDAIQADCEARVVPNYADTLFACIGQGLKNPEIVFPNKCTCAVQPATFVAECNDTCAPSPVNCAVLDPRDPSTLTGTIPPGPTNDQPVCEVSPGSSSSPAGFSAAAGVVAVAQVGPAPSAAPLAARTFGQRARCDIAAEQSTVTVTLDGDSQQAPVSGAVELLGSPCPGTACTVGLAYRLALETPFRFGNFCGGTEFSDVRVVGTASEPVSLDAAGAGEIPPEQSFTSARGVRTDSGICITDQRLEESFVGTNAETVEVAVDWNNKTCALRGTLLGASAENDNQLSVSVDLRGTLANQPPTARAGADQTIECTSPQGAAITLDGTGTTDPDNNIAFVAWRQGSRVGDSVGEALRVTIPQGLGAPGQYILQVLDDQGQLDEDTTDVRVVDTTAPAIASVTASPNALRPPNHKMVPVTVKVSATDACDPAPVCKLVAVSSDEPVNGQGDGNTSPDWQITGASTVDLRAERSGNGSGRIYTLTTECRDAAGNTSRGTTTVTVPR